MKLAHLADLHLGFRQYYRLTAAGVNQREADVANAFRAAVDGVIADRPDAILIAGDVFHAVRPSNYSIVFAFTQLQRLQQALPDAPIVVVAGNHDTPRSSETGSILRLYEELGVHLALEEARRFRFPHLDLAVLAVPHAATQDPERPRFRPEGSERYQVLVQHGRLQDVLPGDQAALDYGVALIDPEVIRREKWSYAALGHYHVQHEDSPRIWYSGALEYVSPNLWGELADEKTRGIEGKGWLLADLDKGKVTRRPVPPSRVVYDAPELNALDRSAAEVDRMIGDALAEVPGGVNDAIVRVRVRNIHRQVTRDLDHQAQRAARAAALHLRLEFTPPQAPDRIGIGAPGQRQPLTQTLAEFLRRRPLPERVARERFVELGLELLKDPEPGMAEEPA